MRLALLAVLVTACGSAGASSPPDASGGGSAGAGGGSAGSAGSGGVASAGSSGSAGKGGAGGKAPLPCVQKGADPATVECCPGDPTGACLVPDTCGPTYTTPVAFACLCDAVPARDAECGVGHSYPKTWIGLDCRTTANGAALGPDAQAWFCTSKFYPSSTPGYIGHCCSHN